MSSLSSSATTGNESKSVSEKKEMSGREEGGEADGDVDGEAGALELDGMMRGVVVEEAARQRDVLLAACAPLAHGPLPEDLRRRKGAEEARREGAARAAAVRLARLRTEALEALHAGHLRRVARRAARRKTRRKASGSVARCAGWRVLWCMAQGTAQGIARCGAAHRSSRRARTHRRAAASHAVRVAEHE